MNHSFFNKAAVAAVFVISFCTVAKAQDDDKSFRFGLKVTPSVNWLRPDLKSVEKDGASVRFGYGLITEFKLASVISFVTGVGGDYDGGKLSFKDSVTYYVKDGSLVAIKSVNITDTTLAHYKLSTRSYKVNYINIPLALKMKTKDIGGITYFGSFGGDLGIRTKAKATDTKVDLKVPNGTDYDPTNIDITKDINLFKMNLNVGAGIEYNLAGSTSLLVSINYRRGFITAPKSTSDFLIKGSTGTSAFKQSAPTDAIVLTLGMLF